MPHTPAPKYASRPIKTTSPPIPMKNSPPYFSACVFRGGAGVLEGSWMIGSWGKSGMGNTWERNLAGTGSPTR